MQGTATGVGNVGLLENHLGGVGTPSWSQRLNTPADAIVDTPADAVVVALYKVTAGDDDGMDAAVAVVVDAGACGIAGVVAFW